MNHDTLTAGELRNMLEDVPEDETVWVVRGGAAGEATEAYRNADGIMINGR